MPSIVVHTSPATRVARVVRPVVPAKAGTPTVAPQMPPRPAASALANTVAKAIESRTAHSGLYDHKGRVETPPPAPSAKAGATRGAAPAPAAPSNGALVATSDRFSVEILASDSGYANRIVWSSDGFQTTHEIGIDNENVGTVQTIAVARGTPVEFGIVSGDGNLYRAGPSSLNADGEIHATLSGDADSLTIGFEDLYGGGDRDFNDAIIRVTGLSTSPLDASAQEPMRPADAPGPTQDNTVPTAPAGAGGWATTGNRSGLGDGTNPGQGAGRARSPNEGTLNPNQGAGSAAARNLRLLESIYGASRASDAARDASRGSVRPNEARKPDLAPPARPAADKPADKAARLANAQKEQAAADARKLKEQVDAKKMKEEADARKLKEAPEPIHASKAKEAAGAGKVMEAVAASKAVELARKSK